MAIKVYNRKGNISLKEKAMVREVEKAIENLKQSDPNFDFKPANNISELEELYNQYAVTDVDYVEAPKQEKPIPVEEFKKDTGGEDKTEKFIDPFNRDEPIVRDYVLEEEFAEETTASSKSSFDEPLSFDESFSIPDGQNLGSKQPEQQQSNEPEPETVKEPMNPSFSEMDSAKQRKKTKRFAKQIVGLTCDLLQVGFVWFTMNDISEAKLTQYEINGEMDLSLLIDMPNGQKATVKEFFLAQHEVIQQESQIDDEDREDLTDALTEVFLEKGIAPTPMQELLLVTARVIGLQTLKAYTIVQSNKAVLNQLRGMKQEEVSYDDYSGTPEPTPTPPPRPPKRQPDVSSQQEVAEQKDDVVYDFTEVMFPVQEVKE